MNRTWCECLEESRELLKLLLAYSSHSSIPVLQSLIEELQVYGNRMEAALWYHDDLKVLHKKKKELKKEVTSLKQSKKDLSGKEEKKEPFRGVTRYSPDQDD